MKAIMKHWKMLLGIFVVLSVSIIGMTTIRAASVGVTITNITQESERLPLDSWVNGHQECFAAALSGVEQADMKSVVWTSSDEKIISLSNKTGRDTYAKAVGAGTAKITVTYTFDNNGVPVSVTDEISIKVKLEVTNDLSAGFIYLFEEGAVADIGTNYRSESGQQLNWSSDDNNVVEIQPDNMGGAKIVAKAGGSASITVRTPDNTQYVIFDIVVNTKFSDSMKLETMKITPQEYTDLMTDTTNAGSRKDITIVSANEEILKVGSDGYGFGEHAGYVLLYLYPKYDYSKTAYASLTPKELAEKFGDSVNVMVTFGITNGNLVVAVGDTVQMNSNALEDDKKGVNWTSDDTNIITIDGEGVMTAKASGVAHITATLDSKTLIDGQRMHSSAITVTVIDSFSISKNEHMMNVGESFELDALVTDDTANVTWISSNEEVVKITLSTEHKYKAVIEGLKKGNAKITAIQEINGVKKYAYCEVSVNEPVQNITLVPTQLEIDKGEQYPLKLIFEPERPDNTQVRWVSSNEKVATVSDAGVITAVNGGDCTISVVTLDGIKVASCQLHVRIPVTGITLSHTNVTCSFSLKTYQLSYYITPDGDGVNTKVIWSSSNEKVLKVDQNGFVTFVTPGKATVLCQTDDIGTQGNNLVATCEFVIEQPVTSVSLDYTDVTLKIGDTLRLTSKVYPENATNKTLSWVSSNTSVVKVVDGLLTAVGGGNAAVMVQSNDSGVTALCNVTVYQPVTGVKLNTSKMEVRRGSDFWLYATVTPDNAANKAIEWTSSNPVIATVDSLGHVTTHQAGDVVITATSVDTGIFASCQLTVLEPVTGISLNITEKGIYKGEKFIVIPTVTPLDADNKAVTFTSSDTKIATVDSSGVVTGVSGGKCIILATTVERGLVASCEVEVYEFVTSIEIEGKAGMINYGEHRNLTAKVLPETATNTSIQWLTSDSSIIQVSQNGVVSAVGYGNATVTAVAKDGSGVFDEVNFTCINPVKSIEVNPSYVSMLAGYTQRVTATVYPSDATIKEIEWTSSNEEIAVVDYNGGITGIEPGICYVYAKSKDGNEVMAIVKVTIKPVVAATEVKVGKGSLSMLPGQVSNLKYRLKPSNSTDTVQWQSSDERVATVNSNGTVTAVGAGSCEIYCIAESGAEGVVTVNVVGLNETSITVEQYDSHLLDVFGASGPIKWYTANNRIATVSQDGTVIGRRIGTTTITARVDGKTLTCRVTVTKMREQ